MSVCTITKATSYSLDFSYPKTASSSSGTSNIVIDDTKFTLSAGCGTITTYTFSETTVSNPGLT